MKWELPVLLILMVLVLLDIERDFAHYESKPAKYLINASNKRVPLFEKADWHSQKVDFLAPGESVPIAYVGKRLGEWYYVNHKGSHMVTHISLISLGNKMGQTVRSKQRIKVTRRILWGGMAILSLGVLYLLFRRKPVHSKPSTKEANADVPQQEELAPKTVVDESERTQQLLAEQKRLLYAEFKKILDKQKADHEATIADKLEVYEQLSDKYQQAKTYLLSLGVGDIEQDGAIESKLKGYLFEVCIAKYFIEQSYEILEWTSDKGTEEGVFVKANGNPDLYLRDKKDGRCFAVECKYRSKWTEIFDCGNKEGVSWAEKSNIQNYQCFANEREVPVWVAVGVGGQADNPDFIALDFLPFIQGNSIHPFKDYIYTVLKEKLSPKRLSLDASRSIEQMYEHFKKGKLAKYAR